MKTKEKKVRGRTDEPEAAAISIRAMAEKFMKKIPEMVLQASSKGEAKALVCLTNTGDPKKLERADKPLYRLLRKAGMKPFLEELDSKDPGYRQGTSQFKLVVAVPQ